MIRTDKLCFAYPGAAPALADVTLAVEPGSLTLLAGANGSGKSTLLALLAGLLTPTSGALAVAGRTSPGDERGLRAAAALAMQDADLQILGSTPLEDLCLQFAPGDAPGEARARDMAARFGLSAQLDDPVQTLSYGQKRKLCLASALLREPSVLLMDEPFAGLDYPAILEMRAVLRQGSERGLTQVVAAHDLECVVDLADRVALLAAGRLVLCGPPAEALDAARAHGVRPPCSWTAARTLTSWE
ncbi:MAG: ABC transporter ATP-binding protein [Desulfovibrionaceae bacterium]|nr:ABC transporter ATP-binding protein [Desulfovibrionaceae bacterium]